MLKYIGLGKRQYFYLFNDANAAFQGWMSSMLLVSGTVIMGLSAPKILLVSVMTAGRPARK